MPKLFYRPKIKEQPSHLEQLTAKIDLQSDLLYNLTTKGGSTDAHLMQVLTGQ